MIVGLSWMILGSGNYFIYKKNKVYIDKIIGLTMLITGGILFILGIINLYLKSTLLNISSPLLIIPATIYMLYKLNRYKTALEVADKLTK